MKEELVSYEIAKVLKDKGFNVGISMFIRGKGCQYYNHKGVLNGDSTDEIRYRLHVSKSKVAPNPFANTSAPTLSLARKWLREEEGQHIVIIPTITSDWTFKIVRVLSNKDFNTDGSLKEVNIVEQPPYKEVDSTDYSTYEEALSKGIEEALKLI